MAGLGLKSKTAVYTNVFSTNSVTREKMDISPDDTPSTSTNVAKNSASVTTFVPFAIRI
jgi:hypothetical protein